MRLTVHPSELRSGDIIDRSWNGRPSQNPYVVVVSVEIDLDPQPGSHFVVLCDQPGGTDHGVFFRDHWDTSEEVTITRDAS